ncbi:unnamed protein product [Brassica oleracea]|uniref:Uncharacterized protein n=2 Tax=Brassica oleracea TaxID=3712 RepID=A0A0D3CZX3_BRAOL|nr:PREDICTED: uncharacterized protein LOC106300216 [Brassica oleracea var. oleracea]VDD64177.1 unnamed protein product [Brassica oleracea]
MRRHSAIALRNLFSRSSLRISQNLSATSSPAIVNSLGDVSGRIRSPCSTSNLIKASFGSMIQRRFSTAGSPPDVNKVVDEINLKFAEAREEIEMAMDAKETVYFNEEAECARAAVAEVMEMFEGLLGKVTEEEKSSLQRSMGLKMEQLKAELQQLNE